MLFNVPQFIDKEDKLVGPLTAKQLGWLIGGGAMTFVFWTILQKPAFIVMAIFIAVISCMMAFYRPNGQPMISFILFSISFLTGPKMYIWKRIPEKNQAKKPISEKPIINIPQKKINEKNIQDLSKILDNKF